MNGIAKEVTVLLALLTTPSPRLWAQESAESRAIEARVAAVKAATAQRTAALLEAENTNYTAQKKVLEDRERASKDYRHKQSTTGDTLAATPLMGRVFAITKGGDVKPALLARVYLFPVSYSINEWMTSNIRARDEYEAKVEAIIAEDPSDNPFYNSLIAENCRNLLSDVDKKIGTDKEIAPESFGPAYTAETDETGNFKISPVNAGDYSLVVRGQAGSNDVLWIDKVTIAGATEALKLHSVAKACRN
jgi:hypothetical protein